MNLTKTLFVCLLLVCLFTLIDGKKKKKKKSKKISSVVNSIFRPIATVKKATTTEPPKILPNTVVDDDGADRTPVFVPPRILSKLRNVNSVSAFIKEFKPPGVEEKGEVLKYITNGAEVKLDFADANGLGCEPRLKIQQLPTVNGWYYWPACEKVFRCGGCCTSSNLQCEPIETRTEAKTFFRIPFFPGGVTRLHQRDLVHHSKCGCRCRVKAEHCLETQTYNPNDCQCECKRKPPTTCGTRKYWSHQACACICSVKKTKCTPYWKRQWDPDHCECRCIKKAEECKKKKKHLDPRTCKCY